MSAGVGGDVDADRVADVEGVGGGARVDGDGVGGVVGEIGGDIGPVCAAVGGAQDVRAGIEAADLIDGEGVSGVDEEVAVAWSAQVEFFAATVVVVFDLVAAGWVFIKKECGGSRERGRTRYYAGRGDVGPIRAVIGGAPDGAVVGGHVDCARRGGGDGEGGDGLAGDQDGADGGPGVGLIGGFVELVEAEQ